MNISELAPRELELVKLVHSGKSVPEAARAMNISPGTGKNYMAAVYQKLGVHTKSGIVLMYERSLNDARLVPPDSTPATSGQDNPAASAPEVKA